MFLFDGIDYNQYGTPHIYVVDVRKKKITQSEIELPDDLLGCDCVHMRSDKSMDFLLLEAFIRQLRKSSEFSHIPFLPLHMKQLIAQWVVCFEYIDLIGLIDETFHTYGHWEIDVAKFLDKNRKDDDYDKDEAYENDYFHDYDEVDIDEDDDLKKIDYVEKF